MPNAVEIKHDDVLSCAVEHFGQPAQVLKCIEECAELIDALSDNLYPNSAKDIKDYDNAESIINVIQQYSKYIATLSKNNLDNKNISFGGIRFVDAIKSELADVDIMSAQMKIIFGDCSKERMFKLDRLKNTIDNETTPVHE
jgi:lipase chaperone LimK